MNTELSFKNKTSFYVTLRCFPIKIDYPPPYLPPCPCGHTIIFEKSQLFFFFFFEQTFCTYAFEKPTFPKNVCTGQIAFPLDCGHLL